MEIIHKFGLITKTLIALGYKPSKYIIVDTEEGTTHFNVFIEQPRLFNRTQFSEKTGIPEERVHIPEKVLLENSNEFVKNDHYITIQL